VVGDGKNPIMTTLAIALVSSRTFSSLELINCGQSTTTKLQGAHLHGLMNKFSAFFSPNIKKLVSALRHGNFKQGPLDNIHE
jgi:hypothetical protein